MVHALDATVLGTVLTVLALLYHDVFVDGLAPYGSLAKSALRYHVSRSVFRRHLDLMTEAGVRQLALDDVVRGDLADAPGERRVFVSFDDGWQGTFEVAAAELRTRGLPATVFVTTDFIGRPLFASVDTLRAWAAAGVRIGSHGSTHRMLSSLPRAAVREELAASRRRLEDWLGTEVRALSIPGGAGGAMVREEAVAAGYTVICDSEIAQNPTRLGSLGVARLCVDAATSDATLRRWLAGDIAAERRRKRVLDVPKRVLGMRNYSRLRRWLLGDTTDESTFVFEP